MEQRIKFKKESTVEKLPEGDNPLLKSLTKGFSKLDFMSKTMSKKSESKEINLLTEEEMKAKRLSENTMA